MNQTEILQLASLFRGASAGIVADLRDQRTPQLCRIFMRAWAVDGVVHSYCPVESGGLAAMLQLHAPGDVPVILLVRDEETAKLEESIGQEVLEQCADKNGFAVVRHGADGRLVCRSLVVNEELTDYRATTTVRLQGKSDCVKSSKLPFEITAQLPRNDEFRRFQVQGENDVDVMPSPTWFSIQSEADTVRLNVSIRPNESGDDAWEITSATDAVEVRRVAVPPRPRQIDRLILVFDRTCPGRDAWSDARRVYTRPRIVRHASGGEFDDVGDGPEESPRPLEDLNEAVRAGLDKAFAELEKPIDIELYWFADTPGGGVEAPEGIAMPQWSTGQLDRIVKSNRLGEALQGLTYVPGLDLWDSLDDALENIVESVSKGRSSVAPVLIVGNSPPNLPSNPRSALCEILDLADLGLRTTVRRRTLGFEKSVARFEEVGMPVAYLFLTGHRFQQEEENDFNLFQSVQARVRTALDSYVDVIACDADRAGICDGVPHALACLSNSLSWVRFVEGLPDGQ